MVDDEWLSLRYLMYMLKKEAPDIQVVGTYSDPSSLVEQAARLRPDAVFLDVLMPEIDGLDLARRLKKEVPDIELIFVTADTQYAIDAFGLQALDYLTKPVQAERLERAVRRLRQRRSAVEAPRGEPGSPLVCCFRALRVRFPDRMPRSIPWRSDTSCELFAYLLHHRDRTVGLDALVGLLWPGLGRPASKRLEAAIDQTRQTLRGAGLGMISIHSVDGPEPGYKLTIGDARVDTEIWESRLRELGDSGLDNAEAIGHILESYEGDYFEEEGYLWADRERERLRLLWLDRARSLGRLYENGGMKQAAIRVHLLIQRKFPCDDESRLALTKLYASLKQHVPEAHSRKEMPSPPNAEGFRPRYGD
nr:response regulator [Cohnella zeiphila]